MEVYFFQETSGFKDLFVECTVGSINKWNIYFFYLYGQRNKQGNKTTLHVYNSTLPVFFDRFTDFCACGPTKIFYLEKRSMIGTKLKMIAGGVAYFPKMYSMSQFCLLRSQLIYRTYQSSVEPIRFI